MAKPPLSISLVGFPIGAARKLTNGRDDARELPDLPIVAGSHLIYLLVVALGPPDDDVARLDRLNFMYASWIRAPMRLFLSLRPVQGSLSFAVCSVFYMESVTYVSPYVCHWSGWMRSEGLGWLPSLSFGVIRSGLFWSLKAGDVKQGGIFLSFWLADRW